MSNKKKHSEPKPHSLLPEKLKPLTAFLSRCPTALLILCLVGLVFLVYSNSLRGPFIFDDMINIEYNPHIRLTHLSFDSLKKAGFESRSPDRPVANLSFALNYYFHGQNTFGYHLINILIHALTGVFLYLFIKTTLSLPLLASAYKTQKWIAFMAALIWVVHPVHTQSVTYIVQRMNSLAALFYVMALFFYARGRIAEVTRNRWMWFSGCALAALLSFGSKPNAATLPFFIFLYEWFFFQDLSRAWLKRRILPLAGVLVLCGTLVLVYLGVDPLETIMGGYDKRDFTLLQRVLTQFRVVIFYISLLLWPHPSRLNLDRDFAISHSLIDPFTTLICMIVIAFLLIVAWRLAPKQRLASFCILWFLGNLVIESSVIALEIIFDHRTYLPSMLVCLLAVVLLYPRLRPQWLGIGVLAAVVTIFSFWTYERNSIFHDHLTFWADCTAKSPAKARPHVNLGAAFARQHHYEKALVHYAEALRLRPNFSMAHYRMANALASLGRVDEAIGHYKDALDITPEYVPAHFKLANLLNQKGLVSEAIAHYRQALQINPGLFKAHNNLGVILADQGKLKEAIDHFAAAIKIQPNDVKTLLNMGNAKISLRRYTEAADYFLGVLQVYPKNVAARRGLAKVKQLIGLKQALQSYAGNSPKKSN